MGVYKRGKFWYIRYVADGNLIRESTNAESKNLAKTILRKRKTEVAEGKHLDRLERPAMTFSELCDWYWTHHGQYKKSNGVKGTIERLKAFFGDKPLLSVTPESVNEYRQWRLEQDGVTDRTVNRDLQELKCMFNRVIAFKRWRQVLENPVSYVKLSKERNERVRYLEPEQIQGLLNAASGHLRPIIIAALHTGMRRGEILNLRWEDVDLKNRIIRVAESKNGEGRHIPMSEELRKTLSSLPSRFVVGYVFPSYLPKRRKDAADNGCQRPFVDLKTGFAKALNDAGISDFRFHDLRHVFASSLVMNGADLNTVRELLGHKSIKMTLRYAHLSPDHKRRAIQLIDAALKRKRVKGKQAEAQKVAQGKNRL